MTTAPIASFSGFSYRYPGAHLNALDIEDLPVQDGLTVITGASGSGKSSLLRVFNGLVPHFHGGTIAGSATVCGHDVTTTPTRVLARNVGFVFQDPELQSVYPTVERDVAFGLENIALAPDVMRERVVEALDRTGITHLRGRAVATLSGGERQRLALAGVLAMRPRVLVLDEPLSQLDEDGARSLVSILNTLAGSGTCVVIAEHRLEHLGMLGGRALAIEAGRIVDARMAGAQRVPQLAAAPAPREASSTIAWQLRGVATGPARVPILEGVDLTAVRARSSPWSAPTEVERRRCCGPSRDCSHLSQGKPRAGRVASPSCLRIRWRSCIAPPSPPKLRGRCAGMRRAATDGASSATSASPILEERDPRDLSSGERQRAAIAAVLAGAPRIALLDEPTRGMDDAARDALCRTIQRLRAAGSSIVIATHDKNLVAALADRTVAVGAGVARELTPVAAA